MSWLALLSLVYFRIFFLAGIDNTSLEFWSLIISNVELFYILFGHLTSFWGCLFTSIVKWLFSVVMGQILALVNWGKDETESQTMLLPSIFAYSWFLDMTNTSHPLQLQNFPLPNPDIISGNSHNFVVIHKEEGARRNQSVISIQFLPSLTSEQNQVATWSNYFLHKTCF